MDTTSVTQTPLVLTYDELNYVQNVFVPCRIKESGELFTGTRQDFDPDGGMSFHGEYKDGYEEGFFVSFFEDGSPRLIQFHHGHDIISKWEHDDVLQWDNWGFLRMLEDELHTLESPDETISYLHSFLNKRIEVERMVRRELGEGFTIRNRWVTRGDTDSDESFDNYLEEVLMT